MNICTGSSGWASFFSFCEVIFTSVLLVIYLRYMLKIVKNKEVSNYEKLDVLVILLSIIQIVLYYIFHYQRVLLYLLISYHTQIL